MRQWFYSQSGQQQGPIVETDLVAMFASGKLHADVLVWTEGLNNWTPARDIENLIPTSMTPPPIPLAHDTSVRSPAAGAPPHQFMNDKDSPSGFGWYIAVMKKYAVFAGRARRKEYWMFFLFNLIIAFAFGLIEGILGIAPEINDSILTNIYQLAVLIPSIAVGVRRMHDTDHSGWWLLLPIVNLVFACTEGTRGDNRFGSDPKAGAQ